MLGSRPRMNLDSEIYISEGLYGSLLLSTSQKAVPNSAQEEEESELDSMTHGDLSPFAQSHSGSGQRLMEGPEHTSAEGLETREQGFSFIESLDLKVITVVRQAWLDFSSEASRSSSNHNQSRFFSHGLEDQASGPQRRTPSCLHVQVARAELLFSGFSAGVWI
ncbi:hypothetical protein CHARACLAT_033658 [Characodon lateralis]|uniref:Uncharacterized protein n=1 Tax=Characodon lateralis TaxID=208331 RepID=A0ABU7DC91_9TELE|nr:hypothetical protein [Characodon lateralis]